jgi:hypothetical protein
MLDYLYCIEIDNIVPGRCSWRTGFDGHKLLGGMLAISVQYKLSHIITCVVIHIIFYLFILVTVRGGPYGCEASRLTHFLDNPLTDGGEVVSLTRRPPFTPKEVSGTHSC